MNLYFTFGIFVLSSEGVICLTQFLSTLLLFLKYSNMSSFALSMPYFCALCNSCILVEMNRLMQTDVRVRCNKSLGISSFLFILNYHILSVLLMSTWRWDVCASSGWTAVAWRLGVIHFVSHTRLFKGQVLKLIDIINLKIGHREK